MRRGFIYALIVGMLFFSLPAPAADKAATDTGYLGVGNEWIVQVDGDILPVTDSAFDIGESGSEVANIYADTLYIGGVAYTSFAAGSDGNWTDNGATVTLDGNPTGVILTKSSGDLAITSVTAGSVVLQNAATLDNAVDGTVTLVEGGDTLSLIYSGTTIQLDSSDGGFQFAMSNAGEGYVDFLCNNDTNDYLRISTVLNVPTIVTAGTCNLEIAPDGGTTTVTGALTATGLATAAGVTTSTTITLQNSETIVNSTNNTVEVGGGTGTTLSVLDAGESDSDATLLLRADASADNGDDWQIVSDGATNSMLIQNDTSGAMATKLTLSTAGVTTLAGGLTLSNAEVISNATDTIVRVASSGTTESNLEVYATGTSDDDAILRLTADADADAGDRMAILNDGATNSMFFQSDTGAADTLATIMTLAKTGILTLTGALTLSNGDTVTNAVDDTVQVASDDTHTVLAVYSALTMDGTAAINLVGDAQANATDSFQIKNDAHGTLTFANDSTVAGTYVTKLSMSSDGLLTLINNETLDNTVDNTVTVGSAASMITKLYSSNATNGTVSLQLVGDAGADTTDGWQIQNGAAGALAIGCDNAVAGTYVTTASLTSAGALTLSGTTDGSLTVKGLGTSDGDATILLQADNTTDNGDDWQIQHDGATNNLTLSNDTSGSQVAKLTLTTAGAGTLTGGLTINTTATTQGIIACGYVNNGYSAMQSGDTVIKPSYAIIGKNLGGKIGEVGTLANGTAGQTITIYASALTGSGTFVITPTTKKGFATITLDAAGEYATLVYVDGTVGWILLGTTGTIA